jgi:hypothetical protein
MARQALARRALEHGVDVARLAGLQLVSARELVAGGHVVEQRPCALGGRTVADQCEQAQDDELV